MDFIAAHAPTIGLLIFFTTFVVIAFWALKPSNRALFKRYSEIPLASEESHD